MHPGSISALAVVVCACTCSAGEVRAKGIRSSRSSSANSELGLCLCVQPGLPEILAQKDEKRKEGWNSNLFLRGSSLVPGLSFDLVFYSSVSSFIVHLLFPGPSLLSHKHDPQVLCHSVCAYRCAYILTTHSHLAKQLNYCLLCA